MFVKQEEAQAISTFLAHYDRDAAYLSPSFLLSGFLPYADSQLSFSDQASLSSSLPATSIGGTPIAPESQLSLMLELAPVWRTFAVQLEECDVLERRGVLQIFPASSMTVTATASSNEWPLKPASSRANGDAEKQIVEMDMCLSVFSEGKQAQLIREQQALEKRLAAFLDTYSNYVDSMSQLFVQWDQAMLDMERSVNRLEVQQRRRLEAISA
ncbi:hypothetical protein K437DRAFT_259811 [Tilletiaria anomala UBC 951]|uniref:Uncharacterized protein n=1 Tax=Tilletiaria anomala (strain ATCC 24038 / CBS 436.72 / UBC 951) TaxID=1037660 RepID=A0A066V7F8_TILAU|nr:uncharacterized protein K437DRAFT_259811 [Tilletiaria anomala UBC 951]KDN37371.1 hypothetical protein K437DRAFT_259811 [Tilletiaria anomala UBC 951]